MQSAASPRAFLSTHRGVYWRARTYLLYRVDERFSGVIAWGEPTERDLAELIDLFARERALEMPRHVSLVDFRRLRVLDPAVFGGWATYAREHRDVQARRMEREAVIRPTDGLVATALVGYRTIVEPAHPLEVFTGTSEALEWLERSDAQDAVEEVERAADSPPLVARLAQLLSTDLSLGAADAAARLGVSTRALQRVLKTSGTTYREEVQRARIDLAKRLLAGGTELSLVAERVGLASQQSFTKLFTRAVGVSPGAWRAVR